MTELSIGLAIINIQELKIDFRSIWSSVYEMEWLVGWQQTQVVLLILRERL